MPKKRLSMRRIREVLRLKHELRRSHREIARSLGIANSTVSDYVGRARAAGLSWPLPEGLDDAALEGALFPPGAAFAGSAAGAGLGPRPPGAPAPQGGDAAAAVAGVPGVSSGRLSVQPVLRALPGVAGDSRRGHAAGLPGGREGVRRLRGADLRGRGPEHRGGARRHGLRRCPGRLEPYLRGRDPEPVAAGLDDVARPDVRVLGGRPRTGDPGQREVGGPQGQPLRAGTEPTYRDLAAHYGTTVLPARPGAPRDKAKAEAAVQNVERWIMAPLRNQTFFSLGELREAIRPLLAELNERPFTKIEGSRRAWFEDLDRPALKPLPAERYEYAEWRKARGQHRLPHPGWARDVQRPSCAAPLRGRRSDHGPHGRDLPQAPPGRRAPADPQERRIRDRTVAHARLAPRAQGVDTVAARRLGQEDRTAHGRVRRAAYRRPAPPRTGLPQLPRAQEAAASLWRRAPRGRMPPRHSASVR